MWDEMMQLICYEMKIFYCLLLFIVWDEWFSYVFASNFIVVKWIILFIFAWFNWLAIEMISWGEIQIELAHFQYWKFEILHCQYFLDEFETCMALTLNASRLQTLHPGRKNKQVSIQSYWSYGIPKFQIYCPWRVFLFQRS